MRLMFAALSALMLIAPAQAQVVEPWMGRWSLDPAGCASHGATASTSPLIVSEKMLIWHVSVCRIGKLYKTGQDAHIQGHCSNDGIAKDTPISLKPHGTKMQVIWDNKPVGEMQKCKGTP